MIIFLGSSWYHPFFQTLKPNCLPSSTSNFAGKIGTAVGTWNTWKKNSEVKNDKFYRVKMKILDNSTDLIIYAGESREEVCYTDTGGGLFLKIGER